MNSTISQYSAPDSQALRIKTYRMGELFCGPGGLGRGAMQAMADKNGTAHRIKHAWANDIDVNACSTYKRNIDIDPGDVFAEPVEKFTLRSEVLSPIDILTFGFPCNDFSQVGERLGLGGHFGPLYTYGIYFLKLFQPTVFVAENVSGIRNADSGETFRKILEEMVGAGYLITPHLYKFEQYGVPQARHRVVIVGIHQSARPDLKFRVPTPSHIKNPRTCLEAIEGVPIPADAANNELTKQSATVVSRLQYIKPGENAWTAAIPEELKLNVKGALISQIYRRLDPSKPAYTVTGSGGGGTHVYHWKEDRALTNRERARLQTFPDDHIFMGSKEDVRKQIGMAVPVQGARVILEAILKTLAGVEYDSIPENIDQGLFAA